jgi:DNA-binding transcriptional LysR family regulator
MGLSPSALNHAIRSLEQRIGVVLLARTMRSVAPTAVGERLLRSLDPALAEVTEGLAALADWRLSRPSIGVVRVSSDSIFPASSASSAPAMIAVGINGLLLVVFAA